MRKTMIYLEEEQCRQLNEIADSRDVSFASVCRQAVDAYLKQEPSVSSDPIFSLIGIGKSRKTNQGSVDHDQIIYGLKDGLKGKSR